MKKQFPMRVIAAALMLASAGAMAEPGLSSNGYFRVGIGAAGGGGDQACYGLGPAKYRLGNECDDYVEFGLDAELPKGPGDSIWKAHVMVTGWTGYPNSINNVDTKWSQLYLSGHNLGDGILTGASLWIGRRYYDRPDIHILDYKYQNSDGDGGGVENLDLGFGKLSWAIERTGVTWNGTDSNDRTADTNYFANLLRLDSVKIHPDGYLTFNLGITKGSDSRNGLYKAEGGWYAGAFYDAKVFDLNAWNRIGIQYGKGSMANGNFGQVLVANSNGSAIESGDDTFQVFDNVSYTSANQAWTMLANVIYRKDKRADQWSSQDWFSIGARPQYHFTDIWGLATEVGYTQIKPTYDNISRDLTKATVALTAAAGRGPYSRPEMRLYYTFAKWNDAAKGWVASNTLYANNTSGSSYGIQAETWW
jgi:maltoporin